jgi:hypothetical protein
LLIASIIGLALSAKQRLALIGLMRLNTAGDAAQRESSSVATSSQGSSTVEMNRPTLSPCAPNVTTRRLTLLTNQKSGGGSKKQNLLFMAL